jgi:hypothetical protein
MRVVLWREKSHEPLDKQRPEFPEFAWELVQGSPLGRVIFSRKVHEALFCQGINEIIDGARNSSHFLLGVDFSSERDTATGLAWQS